MLSIVSSGKNKKICFGAKRSTSELEHAAVNDLVYNLSELRSYPEWPPKSKRISLMYIF